VDINKVSPQELGKSLLQRPTSAMPINKLREVIKKVLLDNQKAVSDYKSGKVQALMFLIGEIMRQTKGQADPKSLKEKLISLLQ